MTAAPEMIKAAVPTPARNCRRSSASLRSGSILLSSTVSPWLEVWLGSAVTSVLLHHLDLVAVGIFQEKETRHQRPVAEEFLDRLGLQTLFGQPCVLGGKIVDHDCQMTVDIACNIRRGPAVVDGELELEIGFPAAQIDQGEIVEREPVGDLEVECAAIEIGRTGFVENPEHRMDGLAHKRLTASSLAPT